MKIGIPRAMFYYLNGDITVDFFRNLGVDVVMSSKTNKRIVESGMKYAPDEMCLSMKNYIGHVSCLVDKCDYLLIPRIDNYYTFNQTCTNFLAARDIINDTFDIKIIDYNIDLNNNDTLKKGMFKIARSLGFKLIVGIEAGVFCSRFASRWVEVSSTGRGCVWNRPGLASAVSSTPTLACSMLSTHTRFNSLNKS